MRSTPTEELFPFPHPQDCCQNAKSISSLQMMFTSIKGLTQLQTCKSSQRLSQGDGAVEVRGGHDVRNKTQMRASGEIRGGSQRQPPSPAPPGTPSTKCRVEPLVSSRQPSHPPLHSPPSLLSFPLFLLSLDAFLLPSHNRTTHHPSLLGPFQQWGDVHLT